MRGRGFLPELGLGASGGNSYLALCSNPTCHGSNFTNKQGRGGSQQDTHLPGPLFLSFSRQARVQEPRSMLHPRPGPAQFPTSLGLSGFQSLLQLTKAKRRGVRTKHSATYCIQTLPRRRNGSWRWHGSRGPSFFVSAPFPSSTTPPHGWSSYR